MRGEEKGLTVRFSDSFQFIFLFDGIRVGRSFRSIDQLISQTLSDGLDVPEGSFTSSSAQQPDGLVDTSKWRDIHSLSSDCTSSTDPGGIFSWTSVDNCIDQHLERIFSRQKMDDFKSMSNDTNSEKFLPIVPSMHHHRVSQSFYNRTLCFPESLACIPTRRVWQVPCMLLLDCDVILLMVNISAMKTRHKPLTCNEMSEIWTSVELHLPNSLISGWSNIMALTGAPFSISRSSAMIASYLRGMRTRRKVEKLLIPESMESKGSGEENVNEARRK